MGIKRTVGKPGRGKAKPKRKWKPAPPELVRRFGAALRAFPAAQSRKMFGYPAVFVNGNMLSGLFQDSMMLRLSERDRAAIRHEAGAKLFEPMPGRVMREYVVVPDAIVGSKAKLEAWLTKGFAYVSTLPVKARGASRRG